ncbi:hypothetical protein AC1031_002237 [Aphanomyces cochlioides]|nr:hypothetical protein AC1031_002237 [Aphanomyces cochlioides]
MDPRRQEDLNLGPDHADAFIAATLRKRDLEYRRLHHANSPEQRDPEKRSRQLPAEYSDEDLGSDNKSNLVPSPALDASEAGPSDHSGSELSLEPRSSLEEFPFWESYDDSTFPTQDLVRYDGDPVYTTNVHFDDAFTPEDGSIVPFSHSTDTLSPTSSAITRTVTTVVSRTVTETTSARTIPQLLPLPEHDELGLNAAGPGNHANRQGPELPVLTLGPLSSTSPGAHQYQSQPQIASSEVPALEYALPYGPPSGEDYQLTRRGDRFGTHDQPQAVHRDPPLLGPTDQSNVLAAVPGLTFTTSEQVEIPLELTDLPRTDPSATDMEIAEIDHGLALLPTVSDLSQRVLDLQDSVRYTETSVSLQLNQMLVDQRGANSALGSLTSAVEVASNRTQLLEEDLSSLEQGLSSTRQDLLNRVQQVMDQVHQVGLTVETTRSVTDSQISHIQSINAMDQDKKLDQATKFTIVPSSDHQDDCAFFIRQLLETADRCQLSDNDRRSLLGPKQCSDKTPSSLRKWWISFAKTKQGETWSDVLAEFQDQFCLRTSRQKVTDLLNDSVRYEDETVRSYATRLQSIIDDVGFPADQGVNLFKLGVRHLKTESCLENTDRELKTIADCVKLLRAREIPLDDASIPASRPKSRAGSVSDTASTYTSQSEASSDRTPPRSPRHNRRGSRVSFDEPSTAERLLTTLLDQQKEFVAHIERSDRHHQSLMDDLLRPTGPHFVAQIQPSPAPQYGQPYGYPYTPFAPQSAIPPAPLIGSQPPGSSDQPQMTPNASQNAGLPQTGRITPVIISDKPDLETTTGIKVCGRCKQAGHRRDSCYRKNLRCSVCREVDHYAGEHVRTCNICKKVGHISSRCPEKTAP